MNPADLCAAFPFSFHFTFAANLGRIRRLGLIDCPGILATAGGIGDSFGARPMPVEVDAEGEHLVVPAHQPAVPPQPSLAAFNSQCIHQNMRVRFFAGSEVPPPLGLDHPQWSRDDAVVLRVPTAALRVPPRILRRGTALGRGAYVSVHEVYWPASEVIEVSFTAEAVLPAGVTWAAVGSARPARWVWLPLETAEGSAASTTVS